MLAVELSLLDEELSLLDESSFFEQEMRERLKNTDRKMKMMSICLTRVSISGLGKHKLYQNMGNFTRIWGFNMEGRDMNLLLKNEQTNRQH